MVRCSTRAICVRVAHAFRFYVLTMKTLTLSLAAIVAFTGAAFADHDSEWLPERRMNANGGTFFVYVRPQQATTTVAVYRQGRGLGNKQVVVREVDRPEVLNVREDAHGRTVTTYGPAR